MQARLCRKMKMRLPVISDQFAVAISKGQGVRICQLSVGSRQKRILGTWNLEFGT